LTSSTEDRAGGAGSGGENSAGERRGGAGGSADGGAKIAAGRVGRPHGLDGSFHVTGAIARLLSPGVHVEVGGHAHRIEHCGGTEQRPLLRLQGVADRDAALALRGMDIAVAAEQAPSLGEGEWWAHQLVGCEVSDGERRVGTVVRLVELPSCEALEVSRDEGEALLVPMVRDAIRSIDAQRRAIEIDLGFLGEQA
jgi:16S rRNA processing protein RimM